MQTSIVVQAGCYKPTQELNELLSQGWKVVNMCGMPSSVTVLNQAKEVYSPSSVETKTMLPTCLVILEKEDQKT